MPLRFPHVLKENKGSLFPSQIIFLDCESNNRVISESEEEVALRFGYALYVEREVKEKIYLRSEWKYFEIDVDFFEWLYYKFRSRRNLYLISANIWFDLRVSGLLRLLLISDFRCSNYFIKGLSQIFTFRKGEFKLVCLNFQNFFRLSVEDMGKIIGREKKKVDFKRSSESELKEYCQEDVKIISEAFAKWREFCEEHDLGTFGKTLPSQAFNAFRHSFMKKRIYIHNTGEASRLEREGYFGGRAECFYVGEKKGEKFYYLDINSFFPYVMKTYSYPIKLVYYSEECSIRRLEKFLEEGCTIAEVNLETSRPVYPTRYNGKTIFPIGTFDTVLSTGGLREALKKGEIKRCFRVAHYESDYIFSSYVDYFWRLRRKYHLAGNKAWETVSKFFLNTLYGKFGQENDEVLWEKPCDPSEFYREVIFHPAFGYTTVITRFGGVEREVRLKASEAVNSFVGICSHVTEYARLLLFQYIVLAGRENVFYCDTDSLITNEEGKKRLEQYIKPDVLGYFKIRGVADYINLLSPKDYIFGNEVVTKGIRKDALKIDENTFVQVQFPSYLGELRTGLNPIYRIHHVTKKLSRKYNKGEVQPSGEVRPFELRQTYLEV